MSKGTRDRLAELVAHPSPKPWARTGRTMASHYKRISITEEERARLSEIGAKAIFLAFGVFPYHTQAVICGAMLSGDYDRLTVVTPWQYGKSWLMGHVALLLARVGSPVYVGANTAKLTSMIMSATYEAVRDARSDIKAELQQENVKKVDRLGATLSRERIGFMNGGAVEAITLGGTFDDIHKAGAMGKGGHYILDEAAMIPDAVYQETLRSNFARTDGRNYLQVAISNPHERGWFYNDLVKDEPDPRHLIIWMDALTAIEDGRWTAEKVLKESEVMRTDEVQKYLLCELPDESGGMFTVPKIDDTEHDYKLHFIGIDSAYKGSDDIAICHLSVGKTWSVDKITRIDKRIWTHGTGEDVILQIVRECQGSALIHVDNGQGLWIVEGLERYKMPVQGVYFGAGATRSRQASKDYQGEYSANNASNLRAEMHLDVQDLFEKGILTVTSEVYEQIKSTLPLCTMERQPNGKIKIRDKQEIKAILGHSPDSFDSLLLAVHAAIMYSRERLAFIT